MGYPITSQITQNLAHDSWSPVGDTTDPAWYRYIRFESGKAHSQAVAILARVVYMYRPACENVRDPESGLVCEVRFSQKFKMDLWQTSRQALSDTFGFTVREVDSALRTLRRIEVIFTELRFLTINGVKLSNVLYIGLNTPKLKMISTPAAFERDTSLCEMKKGLRQKVSPVSTKRKTNTKTSLKTPRETTTPTQAFKNEKSSSTLAPPSTSKSRFDIPETILNLIPANKRYDNELSKVSAALSVSSEYVVEFNIARALTKAKNDDPWGLVAKMLSDLVYKNYDWYVTDRERIADVEEKHAAVRRQGAKAEESRISNDEREARERNDLNKLFLQMSAEAQQIVNEEAMRRVALFNPDAESMALVIIDVIRDIQSGSWEPPDPAKME